jgi:hypothetical protein
MKVQLLTPTFGGQPIFGDTQSFTTKLLYVGLPGAIDTFLGNAPGTTVYGVQTGGRAWACTGLLLGASPALVSSQQATIMALASRTKALGINENRVYPGNFYTYKNVYFVSAEVKFGATVPAPGNTYQCAYNMVMRQVTSG